MKSLCTITTASLLMSAVLLRPALAIENNVSITGNLVNEPCSLSPESAEIPLDFGNVVGKYFQTTSRTPGMPFTIHLVDCDTSIGKSATVTFTGTPNTALPDLLAPDGAANGLAFGIETVPEPASNAQAVLVPINQPSPVFTLSDKASDIALRGFIQGEPDAITNNSIQTGAFTATATFQVDYP